MMLGVVAVLLATQTLAASQQRPKPIPWPCCDSCSACTRSIPPQCLCADTSPTGCHPRCKSCDKFTDDNGATLFECKDRIANFCQRRCTPAA